MNMWSLSRAHVLQEGFPLYGDEGIPLTISVSFMSMNTLTSHGTYP